MTSNLFAEFLVSQCSVGRTPSPLVLCYLEYGVKTGLISALHFISTLHKHIPPTPHTMNQYNAALNLLRYQIGAMIPLIHPFFSWHLVSLDVAPLLPSCSSLGKCMKD